MARSKTIILNIDDDADLKELRKNLAQAMIEKTLKETKGNLSKTARRLGISRPTLYKLMSRFGLSLD